MWIFNLTSRAKIGAVLRTRPLLAGHWLIVAVAVYCVAFLNVRFFLNLLAVYPLSLDNAVFLLSLTVLAVCVNVFLFSLVCFGPATKPLLIIVLLVSALAAYFMDSYHVILDQVMVQNIMQTDLAETRDLLSAKLVLYFVLLGVLPALLVGRVRLKPAGSWRRVIMTRAALLVLPLVVMAGLVLVSSDFYASFFRDHKSLRAYANPSYYIYSVINYAGTLFKSGPVALEPLGQDARIPAWDVHRELIIFVVGETARADRFQLNGYSRATNPYLSQENVISLRNFWSCGTSTSVSVPCMFALHDAGEFDSSQAESSENLLDVLAHAGVHVLWRDNNSDSKGVAERALYQDYQSPQTNPDCDIECRDVGMLAGLQDYIDQQQAGDIFIVLHQMGNHGPAYYKRYPNRFEVFKPACHTNQLESCSTVEIDNAYDNAILYTDYFLEQTITLLKQNNNQFEAALFYVSDHGESLGEYGMYLHGLPTAIAPDAQRHVPAIFWFGSNFDDIDLAGLKREIDKKYTHENVFHTILGLMEIETEIYNPEQDIITHLPETEKAEYSAAN